MIKKEKITDYRNFWLIWMSAAGKPDKGESLFSIQNSWDIKTNYLYHPETGLGKPLYMHMIRKNYIHKQKTKIVPNFAWISEYIKEVVGEGVGNTWYPSVFVGGRWPVVQSFIEKNANVLFSMDNLKVLYKEDRNILGESGKHIFTDIFLYIIFSNMIQFCKKYHADIVLRILSTFISVFADRDLLNYIRKLHSQIGDNVPVLISNESEMNRLMYPFKW